MRNYLIDESPISLQPTLIAIFGFERATVLQQLHFALNMPKSGRIVDGHKYVYNTYETWQADWFPFWEPRTVRHHFTILEKENLVISIQPNTPKGDRTKFYRINYEEFHKRVNKWEKQKRHSDPCDNALTDGDVSTHCHMGVNALTDGCQRVDASNIEQLIDQLDRTTESESGASAPPPTPPAPPAEEIFEGVPAYVPGDPNPPKPLGAEQERHGRHSTGPAAESNAHGQRLEVAGTTSDRRQPVFERGPVQRRRLHRGGEGHKPGPDVV